MFCGGTNLGQDLAAWGSGTSCPPAGYYNVAATRKCDLISPLNGATWSSAPVRASIRRFVLTDQDMPDSRLMGNLIILPDNTIAVVNGAKTGVQGFGCDGPGESMAANPANAVYIYDPAARTWSKLADASVNRGYHSSAALLPDGSIVAAGSSPHWEVTTNVGPFPTEYRLERVRRVTSLRPR